MVRSPSLVTRGLDVLEAQKRTGYRYPTVAELGVRAEAGDAGAQCRLGWEYISSLGGSGRTLPGGWTQAVYWWQKAAEQGDAAAQSALGMAYALGEGVPKDDARAAELLRASAVNGFFVAQEELGNAYANGDGVPQDYVEAYKWLTLAEWSHPWPVGYVNLAVSLAERMTPAQIAEAEKRANDWIAAFEKRQK
jgi:TPR repeat protein